MSDTVHKAEEGPDLSVFAAVVAVVPTSRGVDYETAVDACLQGLTPLLTNAAGIDQPQLPDRPESGGSHRSKRPE